MDTHLHHPMLWCALLGGFSGFFVDVDHIASILNPATDGRWLHPIFGASALMAGLLWLINRVGMVMLSNFTQREVFK